MESRDDERDVWRADVHGLRDLFEAGVVFPAPRRLAEVLAARPPLKIGNAQATTSAIDEQRADRA